MKHLARRVYLSALVMVALLASAGYLITQYSVRMLNEDARTLALTGRQRMLANRMAVVSMKLYYADMRDEARQELAELIAYTRRIQHGLLHGDEMLGLPGIRNATIRSFFYDPYTVNGVEISSLNHALEEYWSLLEEDLRRTNEELVFERFKHEEKVIRELGLVVPQIDKIVGYHEVRNARSAKTARQLELGMLGLILLVLALEARFIFRPLILRLNQDNAALKLANEQLMRTKNQERLAALGQLSSGMSHEINNALQPVLGLGEIVRKALLDHKDEQHAEYVDLMLKGGQHARDIINNVRAFTHGMDTQRCYYPAMELTMEAIRFARELLPSSVTAVIHLNEAGLEGQQMLCNITELYQIYINLLKNASEAMQEKGDIDITIMASPLTRNQVTVPAMRVEVRDTGCGMEASVLKHIFDPFYTTKDVTEGTGLGLSTVYGLMEQYGGTVKVKSQLYVGTVFTLYFPITQGSDHAD
jgi:signal transduction histidine kinase